MIVIRMRGGGVLCLFLHVFIFIFISSSSYLHLPIFIFISSSSYFHLHLPIFIFIFLFSSSSSYLHLPIFIFLFSSFYFHLFLFCQIRILGWVPVSIDAWVRIPQNAKQLFPYFYPPPTLSRLKVSYLILIYYTSPLTHNIHFLGIKNWVLTAKKH